VKKSDQCHGKKFVGKNVAKTFYPLKVRQDTVKYGKRTHPKSKTDCTQNEES
jgi:hypothetical protein